MASLFLRNGFWYISYNKNNRRYRKSTKTNNRKFAEIALKDLELRLFKGELAPGTGDKKPKKTNLSSFFRRFLKYIAENYTKSHIKCEQSRLLAWQNYFLNIGIDSLESINAGHVQDFFDNVLSGRAPRTKKNYLALLKSCINRAVDWDIIKSNPINRVKSPKIVEGKYHYFSTEEIDILLKAAAPKLKIAIILLVNTGMRRGELWGLRWRDIDLKRKNIHVRSHSSFTTKSRRSRSIPMNQACYTNLKCLKNKGRLDDPVYRLYSNKEMLRQAFTRLVRRHKMNGCLHDLRHTFASHLAISGTSILVIKELLGHSSIVTTMIYAHLSPDIYASEVKKLNFS